MKRRKITMIFEGEEWIAYPDSTGFSRYYHLPTKKGVRPSPIMLHRLLYEKYNNVKLTKQNLVFHKDGNIYNNSHGNLICKNRGESKWKKNLASDGAKKDLKYPKKLSPKQEKAWMALLHAVDMIYTTGEKIGLSEDEIFEKMQNEHCVIERFVEKVREFS